MDIVKEGGWRDGYYTSGGSVSSCFKSDIRRKVAEPRPGEDIFAIFLELKYKIIGKIEG